MAGSALHTALSTRTAGHMPWREKMSLEKHGYPIRTGELAVLVREGKMTMAEARSVLDEDREQFFPGRTRSGTAFPEAD